MSSSCLSNYHLPNYMDHCEWAYARFGIRASSWLSTRQHFDNWLTRYMQAGQKATFHKSFSQTTASGPERAPQRGGYSSHTGIDPAEWKARSSLVLHAHFITPLNFKRLFIRFSHKFAARLAGRAPWRRLCRMTLQTKAWRSL